MKKSIFAMILFLSLLILLPHRDCKGARIVSLTLSDRINELTITPIGAIDKYDANCPEIHAIAIINQTYDGTKIRGEWIQIGDSSNIPTKFSSAEVICSDTMGKAHFIIIKPLAGWQQGLYRFDLYIDDLLASSAPFTIGNPGGGFSKSKKPKDQAILSFGISLFGKHHSSGIGLEGNTEVNPGFSAAIEAASYLSPDFLIGFGIEYQFPTEQIKYPGKFGFLPLYLLAVLPLYNSAEFPYIKGQFGYDMIFYGDEKYSGTGLLKADLSGGLFYAIGAGVYVAKGVFEIRYTVNNGNATIANTDFSIKYSAVSFRVGIDIK